MMGGGSDVLEVVRSCGDAGNDRLFIIFFVNPRFSETDLTCIDQTKLRRITEGPMVRLGAKSVSSSQI